MEWTLFAMPRAWDRCAMVIPSSKVAFCDPSSVCWLFAGVADVVKGSVRFVDFLELFWRFVHKVHSCAISDVSYEVVNYVAPALAELLDLPGRSPLFNGFLRRDARYFVAGRIIFNRE